MEPKPYKPPPREALKTIYADADLLIIDKPSGLLSVPGRGPEKAVCAHQILSEDYGAVFTVHRLDMDTSGIMVFSRSKAAQRHLSRQFEQRQVDKVYEALVEGCPHPKSGTIDAPIARYSKQRPLRHLDPNGQSAITRWQRIANDDNSARLALFPQTGRSHQLRLHLASLGHPILGDVFYGDPSSHERLCLHAKSLRFEHPETRQKIEFKSDIPF
ncbi:MAG: RluA family pseudouridine synthase [Pseudomonadota bacterium]